MDEFTEDLRKAINRNSIDAKLNLPDFVLAEYLVKCLDNYAPVARELERYKWRT